MPFNSLSNKLKTLKMTPGLNQPKGYPAIGGMNSQNKPPSLDPKQLAFMQGGHQGNPMGRGGYPSPGKPPFLEDKPKPLFPGGKFPQIGVPDTKIQPVLPQPTKPGIPTLPGSMTQNGQPWNFGGKPPWVPEGYQQYVPPDPSQMSPEEKAKWDQKQKYRDAQGAFVPQQIDPNANTVGNLQFPQQAVNQPATIANHMPQDQAIVAG